LPGSLCGRRLDKRLPPTFTFAVHSPARLRVHIRSVTRISFTFPFVHTRAAFPAFGLVLQHSPRCFARVLRLRHTVHVPPFLLRHFVRAFTRSRVPACTRGWFATRFSLHVCAHGSFLTFWFASPFTALCVLPPGLHVMVTHLTVLRFTFLYCFTAGCGYHRYAVTLLVYTRFACAPWFLRFLRLPHCGCPRVGFTSPLDAVYTFLHVGYLAMRASAVHLDRNTRTRTLHTWFTRTRTPAAFCTGSVATFSRVSFTVAVRFTHASLPG